MQILNGTTFYQKVIIQNSINLVEIFGAFCVSEYRLLCLVNKLFTVQPFRLQCISKNIQCKKLIHMMMSKSSSCCCCCFFFILKLDVMQFGRFRHDFMRIVIRKHENSKRWQEMDVFRKSRNRKHISSHGYGSLLHVALLMYSIILHVNGTLSKPTFNALVSMSVSVFVWSCYVP